MPGDVLTPAEQGALRWWAKDTLARLRAIREGDMDDVYRLTVEGFPGHAIGRIPGQHREIVARLARRLAAGLGKTIVVTYGAVEIGRVQAEEARAWT